MRFEVVKRDGLARLGELELDGQSFRTPAIVHLDTDRYPAPEGSLTLSDAGDLGRKGLKIARSGFSGGQEDVDAHLRPGYRGSPFSDERMESAVEVLPAPSAMLLDSRAFVEAAAGLRSSERFLRPVYCSVMGLPHRLALLVYCGLDLFDSVPLIMASETGQFLTPTGALPYEAVAELPCSCPACSSGARDKEQLMRHNLRVAQDETRLIRHMISEGSLRELVESRIRSDPWLVQNLRLMDLEHHDIQEMHAPIRGPRFHAGSKESLTRPEITRWKTRLRERYRRPPHASVLLLLPCSAKKPYSISQSHARFRQAITDSGRSAIVHEVIVTSPMGLVPRELELFYPAQDYDIPVTGHWDRDEKEMVEGLVSWLVDTQRYDLVISHLGDEREPVNSVLRDFVDTSGGSPGSKESLAKLTQELSSRAPEPAGRFDRDLEDMSSLCRFQFGPAGEGLCTDASIVGRWPNLKIVRKESQLGMLTGDRGMISLTMSGARVLAEAGAYCVEIDDFVPKGNLFAVGIERATRDFRIGDDVAVVRGRDVRAVGVAKMSPVEMELAERGEAVHIRHSL